MVDISKEDSISGAHDIYHREVHNGILNCHRALTVGN